MEIDLLTQQWDESIGLRKMIIVIISIIKKVIIKIKSDYNYIIFKIKKQNCL